jgi:transcriptional regulator with XRE-family HTH domain
MSVTTNFSPVLKELRKQRGLTQEDLAMRTGRSVDAVSQWERGLNWPTFETLIRLADALDVPPRTFFDNGREDRSGERVQLETEAGLILAEFNDTDLKVAVEQLRALAKRRSRPG